LTLAAPPPQIFNFPQPTTALALFLWTASSVHRW
jgi:hypothetical protein